MADQPLIRFRLNWEKAIEALVWLAQQKPHMTFFHLAKVLFFADKMHLQRYARPILGDRYIAMEHGPVPSVVYNILKMDSFLDPDILDAAAESFEVSRSGSHPSIEAKRKPDLDRFSETDVQCLQKALDQYGSLPVSQLRRLTHQERAFTEAPVNGEMDYALMIDDDVPDRDEFIKEIRESAAYVMV